MERVCKCILTKEPIHNIRSTQKNVAAQYETHQDATQPKELSVKIHKHIDQSKSHSPQYIQLASGDKYSGIGKTKPQEKVKIVRRAKEHEHTQSYQPCGRAQNPGAISSPAPQKEHNPKPHTNTQQNVREQPPDQRANLKNSRPRLPDCDRQGRRNRQY